MDNRISNYPPIVIRNPKATHSVVKVNPYQDFAIYFSSLKNVVDFDYSSKLFYLSNDPNLHDDKNAEKTYVFQYAKHRDILAAWSKVSSVYLGEIFIIRKNGESTVSVILQSNTAPEIKQDVVVTKMSGWVTKPDILTIIDPIDSYIELRPRQILEVVLTDSSLAAGAKGSAPSGNTCLFRSTWIELLGEQRIEPLQQHATVPTFFSPNWLAVPVLPRSIGKSEIHMWLRPDINFVTCPGTYDAGSIVFGENNKLFLSVKASRKDIKNKGRLPGWSGNKYGPVAPVVHNIQNTIVPHYRNVELEEVKGQDFDDCEFQLGGTMARSSGNGPHKVHVQDGRFYY